MDPGDREEVFRDLIAALESGEVLDHAQLEARLGQARGTDELLHSLRRYEALRDSVRSSYERAAGLACGALLGDYEVEEPLGRGGMGVVYRARQVSLGARPVALKVLPAAQHTESARRRFRREAEALSGLHHPCLAEVYGYGEQDEVLFFAMRLVEGPTLAALLAGGEAGAGDDARRIRRVVERGRDVASALAVVHEAGLVHRDVKPSNIILETTGPRDGRAPEDRAVLVDFGLVRPVGDGHTLTASGAATPAYASPEQLLGQPTDATSDVFSLGVTLHDLLMGRLATRREQASVGLDPLDRLLPGFDRDLSAVISKATDPEAEWRYRSARELLSDLDAWLAGMPVSARPAGPWESIRRWMRRNPRAIVRAMAATGLLLVAAGAVYGLASVLESARGAKAARAEPDVLALATHLEGTPRILRPILLADGALVSLASRFEDSASGDIVDELRSRLQDNDVPAALLLAASEVRAKGLGAEPLLDGFLLSYLRSHDRKGRPVAASHREFATLLVARLFYERPATSDEVLDQAAPFREVLLTNWRDGRLPRESRLLALTGLSGCGDERDLQPLMDWSASQDPWSEELRVGLMSATRIVEAVQQTGRHDLLDYEALWRPLVTLWSTRTMIPCLTKGTREWWVQQAVRGISKALEFSRRASAGEGPAILSRHSEVCERLLRRDCGKNDLLPQLLEVSAAAGDSSLLARLKEDPLTLFGWPVPPMVLGRLCGSYGRQNLTADTRRQIALSAEDDPQALAHFEKGLGEAKLEKVGRRPWLVPDEDSLLGAILEDYPPIPTATAPAGKLALAGWVFREAAAELQGSARLSSRAVTLDERAQGTARFAVFGTSEVQLGFQLPRVPRSLQLVLTHQYASRPYYPYQGRALLDVQMDGEIVAGPIRVASQRRCQLAIPLPTPALEPGTHEITIRLHEGSTSVYWLSEATIVSEP